MTGSDVATTSTSRIAINIPMHIVTKPNQVRTITGSQGFASGMLDFSRCRKCRIFRPHANREDREVGDREDQGIPRHAQTQWQDGDLSNHNEIVWVYEKPI